MSIANIKTEDKPIKILALSWRDIKSKGMGGAEILTHEMFKGAIADGIEITHISPLEEGLEQEEFIDGVRYIRRGNIFLVILYALKYYKQHRKEYDFVIDQCNTHRFFTPLWVERKKRIFFIHQLTREIWKINLRFPWSFLGETLETFFLRLNRHDKTITVSESTKKDLIGVGFKSENIKIVPIGIKEELRGRTVEFGNYKEPNFIYVGRYASYKGIDVAVRALGKLKDQYPNAKLWVVGKKNDEYIETVLLPICEEYSLSLGDSSENDIVTWGFVSDEKKEELQKNAKALVFPSIREGWGMIITEAGALGTPSITYDAPGTRDAVQYGKSGYLCIQNSVTELADKMIQCLKKEEEYCSISKNAFDFANTFSFKKSGEEFSRLINSMYKERYD